MIGSGLVSRSAAIGGCAMVASSSDDPTESGGASVALIVEEPTPVSPIPALATVEPDISSEMATPAVAKSPTRRSSLR